MNYYELNIEYAMQILYIAKIFHDHGRLGNLLDELDEDVSLADDQIGFVNLTMVECIFEDTRYYSQRGKRMEGYGYTQDRDTYVLRDRLLTRYDDLCRKLEMELGITKVENQFARDLDSAIQRNMQFNSYHYDYLWADSTVDRKGAIFSYDNLISDPHVDPLAYCLEAQRLFDLYQNCVGRRQVETLLENYVESMQAVKIARGHIYFIPRDYMAKLNLLEDFIELLEQHNQFERTGRVPLDANSMFVVDDAKQREKMAVAFYNTARKEIAEYEERATHLIQTGSQSPAILERLSLRIKGLEEKRSYTHER